MINPAFLRVRASRQCPDRVGRDRSEQQNRCMVRMREPCTPFRDEIQGILDGVLGAEGYRKAMEFLEVMNPLLQKRNFVSFERHALPSVSSELVRDTCPAIQAFP